MNVQFMTTTRDGAPHFQIKQSRNARVILKVAHLGLTDVEQWLSPPKLEFFLAQDIFIAFLASIEMDAAVAALPVGVIMGGLEEEGRVWIEILSVHPDYHRQGVATALVQRLQQTAKELGARGLMVDVDDDNHQALRFYKRVGFKQVGDIRHYYYDGSRALILFCPL